MGEDYCTDTESIECIEFYREHPAEFVEKCFGVKLTPYQKMALTKTTSQSQVGITYWNGTKQKYAHVLFEMMKELLHFCER